MSENMLRKVATTVLVVDDEHAVDIADEVQQYCQKPVKSVGDLMDAMNFVHQHEDEPLIILLDLYWPYPNREGTYQFVKWLRGTLVEQGVPNTEDRLGSGQCGLLLMSAYATAEERYAALKQGGGILKKPFDTDPDGLYTQLLNVEDNLRDRLIWTKERLLPAGVIGESEALILAYRNARLAVNKKKADWKDRHIFIFGERGTGKTELVRAIHRWLGLPGEPIHIDCGDIGAAADGQMAQSFFFGHVKGAFTGAFADQPGQFDRLNHGLVHLDNLHCLNRGAQQPLVKFLETGCYTPVGGAKRSPTTVAARLVVTTSENPEEKMLDQNLIPDVWRRLVHGNWFITIPSVRERGTDIILLAHHFCSQWEAPGDDSIPLWQMRMSKEAEQVRLASLDTYHWLGNVSDVRGKVSYACDTAFLKGRRELLPEDFGFGANVIPQSAGPLMTRETGTLKEAEKAARCDRIRSALRQTNGNVSAAARLLAVNRPHLTEIIRGCGIDVAQFRKSQV